MGACRMELRVTPALWQPLVLPEAAAMVCSSGGFQASMFGMGLE